MKFRIDVRDASDLDTNKFIRTIEKITKECQTVPVDSGCGEKYLPHSIRFIFYVEAIVDDYDMVDCIGEFQINTDEHHVGMWKADGHFRKYVVDFFKLNDAPDYISVEPITHMDR